jgi:hypothetical protein
MKFRGLRKKAKLRKWRILRVIRIKIKFQMDLDQGKFM